MVTADINARGAVSTQGRPWADDPVLMSKITVPHLPGWAVARPRIERAIAEGARGPLTTVTGPPGAGKTMAIALWAAASTHPGALVWITLDDYDNQPKVFWSYVVAALRRAGIAVPQSLPMPAHGNGVDHIIPAAARLGAGRAGPAGGDGPRRSPSADRNQPPWTGWPTC